MFVSDLPNTVSNKNIFKICVYIEMSFADHFLKIFLPLIQHVFEIMLTSSQFDNGLKSKS